MTEVYKALLQLDCEWRTVDPYRLRTRWRPNAGVSPKGGEPRNARLAPDYVVRVTLTLYKVQQNICLLYTSPSPRDGLLSRMPSSA